MKKVFIAMVLTLGFATFANAQATRTWVSGVGDDANPCSRTAPCKTFAGAISKTASPGIINCLDPAGFGAVTVTKSIEIDCTGTLGSVLHSGVQGIIVNALTTDDIVLRWIALNGSGTTLGTNGLNIIQARSVSVYDCSFAKVSGAGIIMTNSSNNIHLFVSNSEILNVGNVGLHVNNSGGQNRIVMERSTVSGSANIGVDIGGALTKATLKDCAVARVTNAAVQVEQGSSTVMLDGNALVNSGTGVMVGVGGANPTLRLVRNTITGNTVNGINNGSGTSRCFGGNVVEDNAGNQACTNANVAGQ